jgi:hypothetical protein
MIQKMYVVVGINMKLMLNEIGGQKVNISMWTCKNCIFRHSKWCNSLRISHPFYRWCGNEIYRETSLDIFDL